MTRIPKSITKDFEKKMHKLKIFEKDVKETFIQSSGPGGQNVNKVETCVVVHHIPTDIEVRCQEYQTQASNRKQAWRLLVNKIEDKIHEDKLHAIQKYEKRRRQNKSRPGFLKEEILKSKHIISEKKSLRKKIPTNNIEELE